MEGRLCAFIRSVRFIRLVRLLTTLTLLLAPALPVGAPSAAAATPTVTTFDDAVAGSLRAAIRAANAAAGADSIALSAGTYALTVPGAGEDASATGDLDVRDRLIIAGAGADKTIVDAAPIGKPRLNDRLFHVRPGATVTIRDLTIRGGTAAEDGGGILNQGTLTLERVRVTGNTAGRDGGGIASNGGSLSVVASLLDHNTARNGGALANARGSSATVTNSTLSGNAATTDGGGLVNAFDADNPDSPASLRDTTLTLLNATVHNNQATRLAGGVYNLDTIHLANTIVGGNRAPVGSPDCLNQRGHQVIATAPNIIQDTDRCAITLAPAGRTLVAHPQLLPLGDNGGPTPSHLPASGSPAVDAGSPAPPGSGATACPAVDQRGLARPRDGNGDGVAVCDIGAVEAGQVGAISLVVRNTNDSGPDSLRQVLGDANANPGRDTISFAIPGPSAPVIRPLTALPPVTDPVVVDGTTQPGGLVTLDGAQAGGAADGLTLKGTNTAASATVVRGLQISGFGGHGIAVDSSHNRIEGLTITGNGGTGVRVLSGAANTLTRTSLASNGGLGIDLGPAGVTPNDTNDADSGANGLQNFPVVTRAVPTSGGVRVEGRLNSTAGTPIALELFSSPACDPGLHGEGQRYLGTFTVTTDADGDAAFKETVALAESVSTTHALTATATAPDGSTSEFSDCAIVSADNDTWVNATPLAAADLAPNGQPVQAFLDRLGESRWYKFKVEPNSRVIVSLTQLPDDYDLTLYKDIAAAFKTVTTTQDLARLGAEFAPDAFSPDAFSPDAFSPDAFSPDAFSPDAFSPDAFSPDAFSPDAFSPDAFSPDAFSPDAFSPDAFSPDAFSPDAFSPDAFSPDAFSPDAFSPDAFSSAQMRSLLGVSAFAGTASEGLVANTWDNSGHFYVRVRGRNGRFSLTAPFSLKVTLLTGACSAVVPVSGAAPTAPAANLKTVVVTDLSRLTQDAGQRSALLASLATFVGRSEVAGALVDLGDGASATLGRVRAARAQATAHPQCPHATNLLAAEIKAVVDAYRQANAGLEYVVILGSDEVVPFFRHPDQALLASEKNYVPPVRDNTSSQASLRLGYVLSQDRYGAGIEISHKIGSLPIPQLAVGRLVETVPEIQGVVDAYLSTAGGTTPAASALVTGYDFLTDGARAVRDELRGGLGATAVVDELIDERTESPLASTAWTASQLGTALLGQRHDLIFLAGHFSASSALAADYRTRLLAADVAGSPVDLSNAIVFSAGCHSGYNIVDAHGIPNVTEEPDWARAFAAKKATLIAGTGYQYGDTDYVEYAERLYAGFARQLRAGSGPVTVGKALVAAKLDYLARTPSLRGIHEKTYLQTTLFGLPMLSVNLPSGRGPVGTEPSVVGQPTGYGVEPGLTLGLQRHDLTASPSLSPRSVSLQDVGSTLTETATYLLGPDGVVSNPTEPVLPLESLNVGVPGTVLRGVGFRGGRYTDQSGVRPLTGAATSELRGVHPPFLSNVLFPVVPWSVNYIGSLTGAANGPTWLHVTPAQYRSSAPASSTGALRAFQSMDFRLFYSRFVTTTPAGNKPALAAPPAISRVSSTVAAGLASFEVSVQGDPSAGIQEAWVTYTATSGPWAGHWRPLDLVQASSDSTRWQNVLDLSGTPPGDVRFIVQAANGVGLVTMDTNLGAYYVPAAGAVSSTPTSLAFVSPPSGGAYGSSTRVGARLMAGAGPLAGQPVFFAIGAQRRAATTDGTGLATVDLPLLGAVGATELRATFPGAGGHALSSATSPFTVDKQGTTLRLAPPSASPGCQGSGSTSFTAQYSDNAPAIAALQEASGRPLAQRTVFLVASTSQSTAMQSAAVITDFLGCAPFGQVRLAAGSYGLRGDFSGTVALPGGTVTLDDERYTPSSASAGLAVVAESATVALAVETQVPLGAPLNLRAIVTQEADGSPGDITLAQVQFVVRRGTVLVESVTAPVASDGTSSATVAVDTVGTYTVEATVTGGYFASPAATSPPITVHDGGGTSPGLSTGVGTIDSGAGALPGSTDTGQANFLLTALPSGGTAPPTGRVEFQFVAGGIQFRSTSVTTLSGTGATVTIRGAGTINGAGTHTFVAVGLDGNLLPVARPDAFRIKILNEAGTATLYDSQLGCPGSALGDGAEPCTPLRGGSIVIFRR